MATSLFGSAGADEMQQALINQRAEAFGQQTNEQRLGSLAYKGGAGFGQALGGMFGVDVSDPAVRRASQRQEMMRGLDASDPQALLQMAQQMSQMGDFPAAQELAAKAQTLQTGAATLSTAQATLAKTTLSNAQEAELRGKLQALPQDATEADILAVVSRYGKPEAIMQALSSSATRRETAEARVEAAKVKAEADLQRMREQGANQAQMNAATIASREMISGMTLALKQSSAANPVLKPLLQKDENTDLEAIDKYTAQQAALAAPIANLTPNDKNVRKLELGPVKNAYYSAQNASGNSTPQSLMYENLKSAVDTAVNIQVSAEKGVQTDGDVLRFAKALIGAYGRNDSAGTLAALKRYNDALGVASSKTEKRVESRRSSQKVEAYGFGNRAPPSTPAAGGWGKAVAQ